MAHWFNTEHFAAGRVIIQQGDPGDRLYILVRGKVDVLRSDGARSQSVGRLQDDDFFGEMALLNNQPRNATVKTLTDCVCLSLARDTFNRLLSSEPALRCAGISKRWTERVLRDVAATGRPCHISLSSVIGKFVMRFPVA